MSLLKLFQSLCRLKQLSHIIAARCILTENGSLVSKLLVRPERAVFLDPVKKFHFNVRDASSSSDSPFQRQFAFIDVTWRCLFIS